MFKSVCKMFMTEINSKRDGSHSYRNVHDDNPIKKKWQSFEQKCAWRQSIQKERIVIRTEICMTTIHSKRDGSYSYRNVYEENPFKKKWESFVQKCAWRQSIQKEMVAIRTEMCMTTIHSKRKDSHSYRNMHDDNPFKKRW